jgi:hypothetical protein
MNYRVEAHRVPVSARVAAAVFFMAPPLMGWVQPECGKV